MEPEPLPLPVELPEDGRLFQHVGGDYFRIICCAQSSENHLRWDVIYRSLSTGKIWSRDLTKFTELATWRDGVRRPRYMPAAGVPNAAASTDAPAFEAVHAQE